MPSPADWRIVVGLGNPGPRYETTRHNAGFWAVDAVASRYRFPAFRKKFQAEISEGDVDGCRVLLMKPQTFMNLSGNAVREAASFYKIPAERIVAFHDELDILPGRVKCKQGGGNAGHNGLKSMDQQVGNGFIRVRLGIGHPGSPELVSPYVLSDPSKAERQEIDAAIEACSVALPWLVRGDVPGFTNDVARLLAPPKPSVKKETTNGI